MPDYQHLKQSQCLGKQTAAAVLESLDMEAPDKQSWPFGDSKSNICRELIQSAKNIDRLKQHVIALQMRLAPILLPYPLSEDGRPKEAKLAGSECADVLHQQVLLLESLVDEVASLIDWLDL